MTKPIPHAKVSQYMTANCEVARPEDGCLYTFERMGRLHIRHLPVVDVRGELIGIVTDRDLRRPDIVETESGNFPTIYLEESLGVRDVMTCDVVTVHPHDSVLHAVELFLSHKFGALPVVDDDGGLVGIFSTLDALRALRDREV